MNDERMTAWQATTFHPRVFTDLAYWNAYDSLLRMTLLNRLPEEGRDWELIGPMTYLVGYKWPDGKPTDFPILYTICEAQKLCA